MRIERNAVYFAIHVNDREAAMIRDAMDSVLDCCGWDHCEAVQDHLSTMRDSLHSAIRESLHSSGYDASEVDRLSGMTAIGMYKDEEDRLKNFLAESLS